MLCPPAESSSRKQVRFESPLISSYRKITLPSPPPTPLLSPPRSPLPPPFPRQRISNQHRLVLSRSLPNSPQRKLGQSTPKRPSIGSQKSLATRLLRAVWPSRSTENLHQAASSRSANDPPSRASLPISSSLTLLSSPSPALCRLWEEEKHRRELLAKFQLAIQLQQQCQPIQNLQRIHHFGGCTHNGGGAAALARGIRPSGFGPSPEGACWPALRRCPPACGVNSSSQRPQQEGQAFPWAQKQPNFWVPPPRRSIPSSQSFPPPTGMAASSSSAAHHHPQHAYNELEDFGDDFVPRSSTASRQNRLNSMDSQTSEKVQIRRMSLKEFSGLDLLEEHAQQKAASGAVPTPLLHPWKSAQLPAFGSLIDKFSTRRRSSSSGGAKLEGIGNGQFEESAYNSFDRVLEGIGQAIRESATGGDGNKELEEQRRERDRRGSAHLEKQHSGTSRGSFGQTLQRLTNIRNHLNSTLQSVPNVSPRKAHAVDREKLLLLTECKALVIACKDMVRTANPPPGQAVTAESLDCLPLVQTAVDAAERVVESAEVLIRKSNSIFQAQQLTSNTDQLLKALAETVKEVEKCQKAVGSAGQQQKPGTGPMGDQSRQLVRCSTSLAANLISFTELIRGMG